MMELEFGAGLLPSYSELCYRACAEPHSRILQQQMNAWADGTPTSTSVSGEQWKLVHKRILEGLETRREVGKSIVGILNPDEVLTPRQLRDEAKKTRFQLLVEHLCLSVRLRVEPQGQTDGGC